MFYLIYKITNLLNGMIYIGNYARRLLPIPPIRGRDFCKFLLKTKLFKCVFTKLKQFIIL